MRVALPLQNTFLYLLDGLARAVCRQVYMHNGRLILPWDGLLRLPWDPVEAYGGQASLLDLVDAVHHQPRHTRDGVGTVRGQIRLEKKHSYHYSYKI